MKSLTVPNPLIVQGDHTILVELSPYQKRIQFPQFRRPLPGIRI